MATSGGLPPSMKPIGHYIKIANEYSTRDHAVYYWCLFHAVQTGMKIDRQSPDCKTYLGMLLGTLEAVKRSVSENEAITSEVVGQAHIEEVALKLFQYADNEDRAGRFGKNVVKAFYTAGHLCDVLTLFGELDEKIAEARKYAKWKAAYIHQCLKNGQTPEPGPPDGDNSPAIGFKQDDDEPAAPLGGHPNVPPHGDNLEEERKPPLAASSSGSIPIPEQRNISMNDGGGGAKLAVDEFMQATKLCKYAISAMQYEDVDTALENLEEAVKILKNGKK